MAEEIEEFNLRTQLERLAAHHFPAMTKPPILKIQRLGDDDYEDAPAWLNAIKGVLYIDERVHTFQDKTTQILILHELIHYQLYLNRHPDPTDETSAEFKAEIQRLWDKNAYRNLL